MYIPVNQTWREIRAGDKAWPLASSPYCDSSSFTEEHWRALVPNIQIHFHIHYTTVLLERRVQPAMTIVTLQPHLVNTAIHPWPTTTTTILIYSVIAKTRRWTVNQQNKQWRAYEQTLDRTCNKS